MTSWTAADLPSFSGRTVVITGANSGLGSVTARELARVGAQVVLAVRDPRKGKKAADGWGLGVPPARRVGAPPAGGGLPRAGETGDVKVRRLDLQDLSSVREFADGTASLDVLVNNAGVMAVPYAQTKDGFESQIGTNHLGHFALTNLLLPKVADRVVTVSSLMHWMGYISLRDLNWTK